MKSPSMRLSLDTITRSHERTRSWTFLPTRYIQTFPSLDNHNCKTNSKSKFVSIPACQPEYRGRPSYTDGLAGTFASRQLSTTLISASLEIESHRTDSDSPPSSNYFYRKNPDTAYPDMRTLRIWGRFGDLPSIDPECIATLGYVVRNASLDEWKIVTEHDLSSSPDG